MCKETADKNNQRQHNVGKGECTRYNRAQQFMQIQHIQKGGVKSRTFAMN